MTNTSSPVKRTGHRRGNRRFRVQRLANLLPKEARRVFRQFGFAESAIITRWHEVVGSELSRHSMPLSLKFQRGKRVGGTLLIRVDGPIATELQHLEPVLVEKINTFYGYGAVGKIAIEQGPISARATRARRPILTSTRKPRSRSRPLWMAPMMKPEKGFGGARALCLLRAGQINTRNARHSNN